VHLKYVLSLLCLIIKNTQFMKKLTQTNLGIIALLMLSLIFTQCKDAKDAAVTKFMEVMAEQVNKECPVNVGNGMTMTKCEIEGKKTFKYSFTVADEVANLVTINDHMKPVVIQALKAMPQYKQIKEFEISLIYAYYDSKNKSLGEIKITPEDYDAEITEQVNEAEQMINMIVASIGPKLPMQVDEITTLVECKPSGNNTMEYVYTINSTKKELGPDFSANMESQLKLMVINTPATKKMVDTGVTMVYVYNDKNGEEVCRITLNANDLK